MRDSEWLRFLRKYAATTSSPATYSIFSAGMSAFANFLRAVCFCLLFLALIIKDQSKDSK